MDNKRLSAAMKQSRDDDVMIMVGAFINKKWFGIVLGSAIEVLR